MTKEVAHITDESAFGSNCPENWQELASQFNELVDQLEEDEYGQIDYDELCKLWEEFNLM